MSLIACDVKGHAHNIFVWRQLSDRPHRWQGHFQNKLPDNLFILSSLAPILACSQVECKLSAVAIGWPAQRCSQSIKTRLAPLNCFFFFATASQTWPLSPSFQVHVQSSSFPRLHQHFHTAIKDKLTLTLFFFYFISCRSNFSSLTLSCEIIFFCPRGRRRRRANGEIKGICSFMPAIKYMAKKL